MEEIYIKARAKINLNLEVVGKREDNYHNIKSVFQKINLYDELYIRRTKTDSFELQTNVEALNNQENIIYKAYINLKEKYQNITGIQVKLNKKIPMQAGLAGGSTDCASFLLAMNRLFDLKLSKIEIENTGKSLGADVVPCFYNKAVLAEGIGDRITPIQTQFKYYIIIVKPEIACNTKEMYQKIDKQNKVIQLENTSKIIQALEQENIELLAHSLYNRFEEAIEERDVIQKMKEELIEQGTIRKLDDWFRILCIWNI